MWSARGGLTELHRSETASPDAPEEWEGHFGPEWRCERPRCLGASIGDWRAADDRVYLDVATLGPQGKVPEHAAVALDYLELRARSWRTGCGSDLPGQGPVEGSPCTDGDPTTTGERCQLASGRPVCLPPPPELP